MKRAARLYASLYGTIALTALLATPVVAEPLAEPGDLIISFAFGHDDGLFYESLFRIDPQTLQQETFAPGLREPVVFTSTGNLLALDFSFSTVFRVDLQTGVVSPFYTGLPSGPYPAGFPAQMLLLDDQTLLALFSYGKLWKFDAATQTATLVADSFPDVGGRVLAMRRASPNEVFALVGDPYLKNDRTDRIVRVNLETLAVEVVSPFGPLLKEARTMDLAADGSLLVAVGDDIANSIADGIVRVDPATGDQKWLTQQPVGRVLSIGVQDKIYVDLNESFGSLAALTARGPAELDLGTGTRRILAPNFFAVRGIHVVPGEPAPPACRDGLDNDGDHRVDWPRDPGCTRPDDGTEESDCADGIDNDRDGLVDVGEDDGCMDDGPFSLENPACDDGIDNDGDGYVDADDPECLSPADDSEHWAPRFSQHEPPPRCGLLGIEPLLLALLPGIRRRWRRRTTATRAARRTEERP